MEKSQFWSIYSQNSINRLFIHFSLVIIIIINITETQMDACATYCWMPFKTHVSINVDMCARVCVYACSQQHSHFTYLSLCRIFAFSAFLSVFQESKCDLYNYNESRFKTFWHKLLASLDQKDICICEMSMYEGNNSKKSYHNSNNNSNNNSNSSHTQVTTTEKQHNSTFITNLHHIRFRNFIVIGTRSCHEMHTKNLLQEQ